MRGLCSYQGNFDRLSVGFGQLVQMAEVNRFDADFQQVDNIGRNAGQLFDLCQRQVRSVESSSGEAANRLRCSPVDERLSDSVNRKTYRTNSRFAQLAGNAVSDFDDFVIFGCHYVQLLHVLLKQNRSQNESGGVGNCENAVCLFVRKSGLSRIILHKGSYINVFKEFRHSAAGLTVSVGRNDYKD